MLGAARTIKKSYNGAIKGRIESVIIIKSKNKEEQNSSEVAKKDIKNKIDISKLGVGNTRMREVAKGAVVVGCENKSQAERKINSRRKSLKISGKIYNIRTKN